MNESGRRPGSFELGLLRQVERAGAGSDRGWALPATLGAAACLLLGAAGSYLLLGTIPPSPRVSVIEPRGPFGVLGPGQAIPAPKSAGIDTLKRKLEQRVERPTPGDETANGTPLEKPDGAPKTTGAVQPANSPAALGSSALATTPPVAPVAAPSINPSAGALATVPATPAETSREDPSASLQLSVRQGTPALPPQTEETKERMNRAVVMIRQGDIAGARVLLSRLARSGDSFAAFALAQTYDPTMLKKWGVLGIKADADQAQKFYQQALEGGIDAARGRLADLAALAR
jgi:hypothetical protein